MKTAIQKKIIMGQTAAVVGFVGFAVLMFLLRAEIRHTLGVPPGVILMIVSASVAAGTAMAFMKYLSGNNGTVAHGQPGVVPQGRQGSVRGTNSDETVSPSVTSVNSVAKNPDTVFSATSARLQREIHALSRRGNLNLTIGVITTGFALGLLAYMIFDESTSPDSFASALSHYLPRVTTVTFIEVFSFFFLKLYRTSLQEIKFYQNELTSLASLQIALATSHTCPDPDALRTVVDQLSRRNPNGSVSSVVSREPSVSVSAEDASLASLADILTRAAGLATGTKLK